MRTQSYEYGGTNRGNNRRNPGCVGIIELHRYITILVYNMVAICYISNLNGLYYQIILRFANHQSVSQY